MGNIPACVPIEKGSLPNGTFTLLYDCDAWAAVHIANAFMVFMLTQRLWFTIAWGCIWEAIEVLVAVLAQGSYVVFAGADNELDFEDVTDIMLGDLMFQKLFGILLAYSLTLLIKPPTMVQGWYRDRGKFLYYIVFYLVLQLGAIPYAVQLKSRPFPIGRTIFLIWAFITFAYFAKYEPRRVWSNRPTKDRINYWAWVSIIYTTFLFQAHFDWFYSGHVQTWLVTTMWWLIFFVIAVTQGRWRDMARWFDCMTPYLKADKDAPIPPI